MGARFLDALEHLPNKQDSTSRENILQKRVESLERQMACISGQVSMILEKLDTIVDRLERTSVTLESQSSSVTKGKTNLPTCADGNRDS